MYKALYREFRPRRFSELKGQEAISSVLKNQLQKGSLSHAYLFAGARGTGKTTSARIFACSLNCTNLVDGEPCLECDNCKAALNDTMPDIIEMDAASNNSVENARDIREKINLLPVQGKYKIYIIDEVHMLSGSAFNALLKTLEEPPSYAVFILATTELNKLPKTVLSRCQRFDFKNISEDEIVKRLQEVLSELGAESESSALYLIANAADGALRDALTLLEKCYSVEKFITESTVNSILNLAETSDIERTVNALLEYDEKTALLTLESLIDSGIAPATLAGQLLQSLRQRLILSVSSSEQKWDKTQIIDAMDYIANAETKMRMSTRPFILLETAIMRILLPERGSDVSHMVKRMDKLEKSLKNFDFSSVAPSSYSPLDNPLPQKARKPRVIPKSEKELWDEIIKILKKDMSLGSKSKYDSYPIISSYVKFIGLNQNTLEVSIPACMSNEFSEALKDIQTIAQEITGQNMQVTPLSADNSAYDADEIED